MAKKRTDLKIPYGVSDFRTIREKIPALAKGTTLHLILVQYRGSKMCTCELVGENMVQ